MQTHLDSLVAGEACLSAQPVQIRRVLDPSLAAAAEALHDLAFPLPHLDHIDSDRTGTHPIVRAAPGEIGDPSTGDHRLGWCTTLVDAGTADVGALDQRGPTPGAGQCPGQRAAGLAGTYHDRVVGLLLGHRVDPPRSSAAAAGHAHRVERSAGRRGCAAARVRRVCGCGERILRYMRTRWRSHPQAATGQGAVGATAVAGGWPL